MTIKKTNYNERKKKEYNNQRWIIIGLILSKTAIKYYISEIDLNVCCSIWYTLIRLNTMFNGVKDKWFTLYYGNELNDFYLVFFFY